MNMYINICIYIYTHICIYTYTHMHIYIYMCFWNSQLRTRANGDSEKECWPNIVSQYTSGNNSRVIHIIIIQIVLILIITRITTCTVIVIIDNIIIIIIDISSISIMARARCEYTTICYTLHFSICACHPCAGAMLIFSVSFQF